MNQFFKWGGLILLATLIGLGSAAAVNVVARAQQPAVVRQGPATPATTSNPYGYSGAPWRHAPGKTVAPGAGVDGYDGWGRMGPGMHGGMMSGYGWGYGYGVVAPQGTPLPVDEEIQLEAVNLRFEPASITVNAGETVRLVIANKDSVPHNLYGVNLSLTYALLPVGVIRSVTFTAPVLAGTYQAVCTYHSSMTLEIIVK